MEVLFARGQKEEKFPELRSVVIHLCLSQPRSASPSTRGAERLSCRCGWKHLSGSSAQTLSWHANSVWRQPPFIPSGRHQAARVWAQVTPTTTTTQVHCSAGSSQDWSCHVVDVSETFPSAWFGRFQFRAEETGRKMVKSPGEEDTADLAPLFCRKETLPQVVLLQVFALPRDTTQLTTALKWRLWVNAVGLAGSHFISVVKYRWIAWKLFCHSDK